MDLIVGVIIALIVIDHYERTRDPDKRDFVDRLVKRQRRERWS